MKPLKSYLFNYKKQVTLAPLFKFFETLTDIISPFLVSLMIDKGVANNDTKYIFIIGGIVLAINLLGYLSAIVCQKYSVHTAVGVGTNLRYDLFAKINSFSYAEIDKFTTASLNNRLTHDVARAQSAISVCLRNISRIPFLLIGSIVMAMIIDLKLSLIFLAIAPLIVGAVFLIMKLTVPLYDKSQKALDSVSSKTKENLQGARVIRAFNKEEVEEQDFSNRSNSLEKAQTKVALVSSFLNPITTTIANFAIVVILWAGGLQVNVGSLTSGQVIAFISYLSQITVALISLANIIISLIKAVNCYNRIKEVFNTDVSIDDKEPTNEAPKKSKYKIELDKVSFGYGDASKYSISNLSLKVEAGQTIGIIGGTGSGKSTISYLLPRFYNLSKGKIKIDGQDINSINPKELRAKFGIVPQRAVLFSGTLRENMQWRKPDATDEEIYKALEIAQAKDFVDELDKKLDFQVQAGGKNFSGGQRQRLTIARAIVGEPEIIILDDSSSALDFATDYKLRSAIKKLKNQTTFLISQRANSLKNCDNIIVLDKGKVVQIGKHSELLKTCPVYKEIYDSQNK